MSLASAAYSVVCLVFLWHRCSCQCGRAWCTKLGVGAGLTAPYDHRPVASYVLQANGMIQESVRDTGLLAKAAQTGVIKIWGIVLKELRGRSLLQEVLHVDDNGRFSTPPPQIYNGFLFCFLTVSDLAPCLWTTGRV